jgi:hypothetical protein
MNSAVIASAPEMSSGAVMKGSTSRRFMVASAFSPK